MRFTEIIFYILAALATLGALAVIASRSAMRCAVGLLTTVLSLAGVYVLMHAHLVAIMQVLVYAGGITVLFGFVIMLLKQGQPMRYRGPFMPVWIVSLVTACYLGYLVWPILGEVRRTKEALPEDFGTIDAIGRALTSAHLVPFEVVALFLVMTMVGVIALAQRPRKETAS